MSTTEQRAAVEFAKKWHGRGDEKQETQRFWIELLQDVLGRRNALDETEFEHQTAKGGYIDVLCPNAKFLVEQKSLGIDLDKAEQRQNTQVTPVEQALRYANYLPADQKPTVICTCNFERFRFYDLNADPAAVKPPIEEFTLEELPDHLSIFEQIFAPEHSRIVVQQQLSEKAGVLVANLHNALAAQYIDPDAPQSHHALAVLTVRIVFCLYAEDAGLFNPAGSFTSYVKTFEPTRLRTGILALFDVLNTAYDERDPYLDDQLKLFPYVNGGLFAEQIEVPQFSGEIQTAITDAGDSFDWKDISPVIFGSLMEETLSHDQRRAGGMHYTTVENIHRVIDPLFLDDLKAELSHIETEKVSEPTREKHLRAFQDKIAGLQFLDPACGSGNFLTETFLELRKLENRVLEHLLHHQGIIDFGEGTDAGSLVKVSIAQMHGIEINDFAVSVAKTALWIAQQQALDATESISGQALDHLPLHDAGSIIEANSLRFDWNELLPGTQCDYVMGNPPFIGHISRKSNPSLSEDMKLIWGRDLDIDYVACWYIKAATYLENNTSASFAFVSTNSITQGKQPAIIFPQLISNGWRIKFAHRTFAWNAQSSDTAHVHVVIIGMDQSSDTLSTPVLYQYGSVNSEPVRTPVKHINPYLIETPDCLVISRSNNKGPLSPELQPVYAGSMPNDGKGNLILNNQDEHDEAMSDSIAKKYVRKFLMGDEFINGRDRWCLWMQNAAVGELEQSSFLKRRIEAVRTARLSSSRLSTRENLSQTPQLFGENHQPSVPYVGIPKVFSGNRRWATCARLESKVIAGDMVYTCIDPDGFMFAVIESSMFITWQKTIGGRLKSDYRFSNTVVWNNLPLPQVESGLRESIIQAGQHIEGVRACYPTESLASLYSPLGMHPDLIKVHEALDRLVDKAFGAEKPCHSDEDRLTILFARYAEMTKQE
ncbi:class I SAM-dependent DNA methyltransferase [Bifidobacterium sp. ESL0798]|uniref:DNA methyltransferase n=1 Tax=Bifidobacterium sp. ESL0798 TaxID=2983235 RepID=UPI0023F93D1A|nr:DNA methyltransferase [Bifidobacterium sp. ESL0798]WEV74495.1 class I SAM-dependent DNA methyltransferase [Bifidobacterium sp. ESL0798]